MVDAFEGREIDNMAAEAQAPARWAEALAALAEALGVQDTEQLEALLREHLDEFLSVPGAETDPAEEIARRIKP